MAFVVEVQNVDKHFRLHKERHKSLKDRVLHPGQGSFTDLHVLQDVSFNIGSGETVGVLGRNGSGKSTLLKCICGVLQPTSGQILVRGELAGLLELGAGFQPELSGRDNIYLSASMLGLSRRKVDGLIDEIVEFSELEKFIDSPVKFFSSGMYVRLGFAVAVTANPDVLVVDEVLAVGDERFQAKCMDRIRQFQADGRTILLVSHNADQVRALCDRAVVLEKGRLVADAPAGEAVRVFREHLLGGATVSKETNQIDGGVVIESMRGSNGSFMAQTGQRFEFEVTINSQMPVEGSFVMELYSQAGSLVVRTDPTQTPVSLSPGTQTLAVAIEDLPLTDGSYQVNLGIVSAEGNTVFAWREQIAALEVSYAGRGAGLVALRLNVH